MADLHAILPICITDRRTRVEELEHYFDADTWRSILTQQASASDADWPCHLCQAFI